MPTPSAYGINESEFMSLLPTMAEQAQASGSPGNNPRIPSVEDMVHLYKKVWQESKK